jgi:hypothetical protein
LALQVTAEAAQRMLKDLIYEIWTAEACESPTDTLKLMSLVDFYLPFLPLERDHIRSLFIMRLRERQAEVHKATKDTLTWCDEVLDLLVSKVTPPPPPHLPLSAFISSISRVISSCRCLDLLNLHIAL